MMRLTFTLCVAIYAAFIIWGNPTSPRDPVDGAASRAEFAPTDLASAAAAPSPHADIIQIALEDGTIMSIDRVVRPGVTGGDVIRVGYGPEPTAIEVTPATGVAVADTPDADLTLQSGLTILVVTGSRVNLRAGPSTDNGVITALSGGARTELLDVLPNGWMHIRDIATGAEGYMSGDFLTEADA